MTKPPQLVLRAQSDERLASLAAAGQPAAFEAIVQRYRSPLLRYMRRLLPESRAEDVLQHALTSAWASLRDGADVGDLRPWLYRISRNAALNELRRRGYDYEELAQSLQSSADTPRDVERRAVMRETLAAVAALPERQRSALLQTAVMGRGHAEVAAELKVTEGALRQLLLRSRRTLRAGVTAITPLPFAVWAAGSRSGDGFTAARIAEVAGGGASAGPIVGAGLAKATAVVAAVGAVSLTPAALDRRSGEDLGPSPATANEPERRPAKLAAPAATAALAPSREDRARDRRAVSGGSGDAGRNSGRGGGEDEPGDTGGRDRNDDGSDDPERRSPERRERDDDEKPRGGSDSESDESTEPPTAGEDGGSGSSGPRPTEAPDTSDAEDLRLTETRYGERGEDLPELSAP